MSAVNYNKLRGLIREKYRTEGDFASAIGVSKQHMSAMLNEKKSISLDHTRKMAEALELTPDEIKLVFFAD